MKLRLQGNSLRLRLSEAEVNQFAETGWIEEKIILGPDETQSLRYVLRQITGSASTVDFTGNTVTVNIPQAMAEKWVNTDLIGFDDLIPTGPEKQLRIVIEKDLDCRH